MVNSSSIGCDEDENRKASCVQVNSFHSESQSSSPITASSATQSRSDFIRSIDINLPYKTVAVEPTPTKTDLDVNLNIGYSSDLSSSKGLKKEENEEIKKSFFCSVPLEKVQTVLKENSSLKQNGNGVKVARKVLCLYCERTFVNVNLRQKHTERCHSSKQLRRVSLRKNQNCFTSTPCIYCDKYTSSTHTLKELFEHLVFNHSNKYFGCLLCEDRYFNFSHLTDHNALCHNGKTLNPATNSANTIEHKLTHSKHVEEVASAKNKNKGEVKTDNKLLFVNSTKPPESSESIIEGEKKVPVKNLRNKKLSVKSSRMIIKRSKRLQAKLNESYKKKRIKDIDRRNKNNKHEQIVSTKLNEKSTKMTQNSVNPYPEFDSFFQVKKITDHSIDNLKIGSLTFDDVFDKAFFNRIKCNIQENLLHHIDGKLFKNEASESRISNFEKVSNISQEAQNLNSENYGCELSLNAITPTTSLLSSSQFGEDPESQIEYGSKASKKKTQIKKDEGHYKYFTRRKYQASILEHKENRDLSKLDIWTQYIVKNRQQKVLDDKKSPKEILDYFSGEEYKNKMKREELNRILDRRGPFEDLREEVSKKAALDKLNGDNESYSIDDSFIEVGELLNDILDKVFETSSIPTSSFQNFSKSGSHEDNRTSEIPSYLNLRPASSSLYDNEIDKSDRIALICSSQETENFEHPNNTVRDKNEKVELTGEWARSRIFVCAACGIKLQNIKQFLEHRSASHQYVWVQHYEFVGNQSELYQHLSIPVLGKVGVLEGLVQCKVWKRSDSRLCTKCGKQCNSLGELHRHILECGGDWTWMLARKKCKYRPFGAKSRRKRRGLVKRIYTQKTEPSEKKSYKKSFDIPRQKPSDADTIQRMLANLPPKRITRKIICLKEGFKTTRNKQSKKTKQSKFNCGKLIRAKSKEQNKNNNITKYTRVAENNKENYRRSLRCLNKVLTSRILDTNSSLIVRRKYKKKINNHKKKNANKKEDFFNKSYKEPLTHTSKRAVKNNFNNMCMSNNGNEVKEETKSKRTSPRIEKRSEYNCVHKTLIDKMNIKRFFPVKKKTKNTQNKTADENKQDVKSKVAKTNHSTPKGKQTIKEDTEKIDENSYSTMKNLYLRKRKLKNDNVGTLLPHKTKNKSDISVVEDCELHTKTRKQKNGNKSIASAFHAVTSNSDTSALSKEPTSNQDNAAMASKNESTESSGTTQLKEVQQTKPSLEPEEKDVKLTTGISNPVKCELELKALECNTNLNVLTNNSIIPPSHSEKIKKKIRKPARGLNDCIAMLTSKLGKNFEDSSVENGLPQICQENNTKSLNSEYVLKVPLFNEHFQLYSKKEQNEVLDILNDSDGGSKLNVEKPKIEKIIQDTVEITSTEPCLPSCDIDQRNDTPQEIVVEKEVLSKPESIKKKVFLRKSFISLTQKNYRKPINKDHNFHCMSKKKNVGLNHKNNILMKNNRSFNLEVKKSLNKKRKDTIKNSDTVIDKKLLYKKQFRKAKTKEPKCMSPKSRNVCTEDILQEEPAIFDRHNMVSKEEFSSIQNENVFKTPVVESCEKNNDTDSEDEIPLAVFLKDTRWQPEELFTQDNQNRSSELKKIQDEPNSCSTEIILNNSNVEEMKNTELENSGADSTVSINETVLPKSHCKSVVHENEYETEKSMEECKNMTFKQLDSEVQIISRNEKMIAKITDTVTTYELKECTNVLDNNEFNMNTFSDFDQSSKCLENEISKLKLTDEDDSETEVRSSIVKNKVDTETENISALKPSSPLIEKNEVISKIDLTYQELIEKREIICIEHISENDIVGNKEREKSIVNGRCNNEYSILNNGSIFPSSEEVIVAEEDSQNLSDSLNKSAILDKNQKEEVNEYCEFVNTKDSTVSEIKSPDTTEEQNKNDVNSIVTIDSHSDSLKFSKYECFKTGTVDSKTNVIPDDVREEVQEDKTDENLPLNNENSLRDDAVSNASSNSRIIDDADKEKQVKELRRSKRNSKRITSYNEIDLVDPLLDEIDANISDIIKDATDNIYINKTTKNRKVCSKKNKSDPKIPKSNGDDLFDLLKATSNENILPKPADSFLHHFDDISDDFNDDNFDVLGDILEKSIAVIEKDLTEKAIANLASETLEFPEENPDELITNLNLKTQSSAKKQNVVNRNKGKKKSKKNSRQKLLGKEIENKLELLRNSQEGNENVSFEFFDKTRMEDLNVLSNKTNDIDSNKKAEINKDKVNYCEICNKSFCRVEGLTKHKRTLTHISKLSEIEAREASLKSKPSELNGEMQSEIAEIISDSKKDLSLLNILKTMDTNECKTDSPPYSVDVGDSHIKLTDIINDVLNKPILKNCCSENTFSNILTEPVNEAPSETKRYRSLAERKSFESESCTDIAKNDSNVKTIDCFEPEITNAAGTILERQISLLENIIENRSALSYIDELSMSSTQSVNENVSVDEESVKYSKQNDLVQTYCKQEELNLTSKEEGFLRPSQYEEISEDSNHRHYDEQKSRKILNRDEELFLECCSLLKSGSEVSNYSKNSAHLSKDFSNVVEEKRFNKTELLEPICVSQKEDTTSDNSRITIMLDDNFSHDESSSITISSNWDGKHSESPVTNKTCNNNNFKSKDFTFEKIFHSTHSSEEQPSSAHEVTSEDFVVRLNITGEQVQENGSNASCPETRGICNEEKDDEEFNNPSGTENRKILTKGAMKEFEGLKVSIPTEDLNMANILTCNPPVKMVMSDRDECLNVNGYDSNEAKLTAVNATSRLESKSGSKARKKHSSKLSQTKKLSPLTKTSKIHDIYDFEETQDNSDIFTKPDFRSFRSNSDKNRKSESFEDSDNESRDCVDTINFDAFSSSTSSVSEMTPKKSKSQQNITKKKCMIMGRIFKNAAKSRNIDENIRNIPVMDNAKLVEDFVLSCPEPSLNNTTVKASMTEEEMNAAFDSLLNSDHVGSKPGLSDTSLNEKSSNKSNCNKKKSKSKNRKRSYWHSDSSDDEFKLQSSANKRVKKKNSTTGEGCINLEQELKECIGVASRKSQRKCTSGKQNVLIEYWSSDESLFEPAQEYSSLKNVVNNELSKNSKISEIAEEKIVNIPEASSKERSLVQEMKKSTSNSTYNLNRRKRAAVNPLYHWSSSSEDESHDLIEVKPVRDEFEDDDERPVQHGWIVGDSPKKLVTMLAQAKGKKCEIEGVKEHGKKRTNTLS